MKKILINLTSSLFTVIFSLNANAIPLKEGYQPADKAANSATKLEEKGVLTQDRLAELMCEAEEIIERWAKNHDEQ